jgi:hypothetical protein
MADLVPNWRRHVEKWREVNRGKAFGRLTAIEPIGRKGDNAVWSFRCVCGAMVEREMRTIHGVIARGYSPACEKCAEVRCCSICKQPGHQRPTCPEKNGKRRTICQVCNNLPHRRQKPACPKCEKPHEEES